MAGDDETWEKACLHGVAPLVFEGGSLRFARRGFDPAEALLTSPEGLPDAEVVLRTFDDPRTLSAFAAGVAEVGGNAVQVILPDGREPTAALVLRSDRTRPAAATVEEAIPHRHGLSGSDDPSAYRAGVEAERTAETDRKAAGALRSEWAREWAVELRAVEANPRTGVDHSRDCRPGMPLHLFVDRHGSEFRDGSVRLKVVRQADGTLLASNEAAYPSFEGGPDEDLASDLRAGAAGLGLERGDGRWCMRVRSLAPDHVEAVRHAFRGLDLLTERATKRLQGRRGAREATRDVTTMKVLARVAAGYPVMSYEFETPRQVVPRTGAVATLAKTRVWHLLDSGWLRSVWSPEQDGRSRVPTPEFLGLTEAAVALLDGDVERAGDLRSGRGVRTKGPSGPLGPTLLEAFGTVEQTEATRAAVALRFPERDVALADVVGPGRDPFVGWGLLAAGLIGGQVNQAEEMTFSTREPAASPAR